MPPAIASSSAARFAHSPRSAASVTGEVAFAITTAISFCHRRQSDIDASMLEAESSAGMPIVATACSRSASVLSAQRSP